LGMGTEEGMDDPAMNEPAAEPGPPPAANPWAPIMPAAPRGEEPRNECGPRLLRYEPGDVPSRPLPSGGVAPMSQPTELEGGDSPCRPPRRLLLYAPGPPPRLPAFCMLLGSEAE
jgi:hypothetical protein